MLLRRPTAFVTSVATSPSRRFSTTRRARSNLQVKFKAVGEPLVEAARIEAQARAGEVWICAGTRDVLGELANVDREAEIPAAAGDEPLHMHRVLGLGGSRLISLRSVPDD